MKICRPGQRWDVEAGRHPRRGVGDLWSAWERSVWILGSQRNRRMSDHECVPGKLPERLRGLTPQGWGHWDCDQQPLSLNKFNSLSKRKTVGLNHKAGLQRRESEGVRWESWQSHARQTTLRLHVLFNREGKEAKIATKNAWGKRLMVVAQCWSTNRSASKLENPEIRGYTGIYC